MKERGQQLSPEQQKKHEAYIADSMALGREIALLANGASNENHAELLRAIGEKLTQARYDTREVVGAAPIDFDALAALLGKPRRRLTWEPPHEGTKAYGEDVIELGRIGDYIASLSRDGQILRLHATIFAERTSKETSASKRAEK